MNQQQRNRIEKRAYEIYITRGGQNGNDMADWLRAENEVLKRSSSKSKTIVKKTRTRR